jgi:hypothetical protein
VAELQNLEVAVTQLLKWSEELQNSCGAAVNDQ